VAVVVDYIFPRWRLPDYFLIKAKLCEVLLPDDAQKRVDGLYVQPDFYYHPRIWVFCDGTPHDDPAVKADDENKRQAIIARGDEVWAYYYKDNLADITAARPDIFKKVR
jgi:hypothetical protein